MYLFPQRVTDQEATRIVDGNLILATHLVVTHQPAQRPYI
jgi:hypothetical protein